MKCAKRPDYEFNGNNHLNQWLFSIGLKSERQDYEMLWETFTIAITRYEYVNIYHTMTDFYNAFMLMEFFNYTQGQTNILIMDGHPRGTLDPIWSVLFNSTTRLGHLKKRTKFTNLVWNIQGYNSYLMDHFAESVPLIEEFRTFFLKSYRIIDNHVLNCDKISLLFIWRHDYVAHPRNPNGFISRKIYNENELVNHIRAKFPGFKVNGLQIDLFSMNQQLDWIVNTDILIGMHGAGLTHTLFLPSRAGVVELLPNYWTAAKEHFEALSRWRELVYEQWTNSDPHNEKPNRFTRMPPVVVQTLVRRVLKKLCPTGSTEGNSTLGSL